MFKEVHPKLPMRNKSLTKDFYIQKLGFTILGNDDFSHYLMIFKDNIQIHFFEFQQLNPTENYGQIYIRTNEIKTVYHNLIKNDVKIHPNGALKLKPWGQLEFSILDPDNNLITFGQEVANY